MTMNDMFTKLRKELFRHYYHSNKKLSGLQIKKLSFYSVLDNIMVFLITIQ